MTRSSGPQTLRHAGCLMLGLALTVALMGCGPPVAEVAPTVKAVKTMVVDAHGADQARVYTGRAAASHSATLSFPMAGTVEKVLVDTGDRIKPGQLLATLDARALLLDVDGARADLLKAESTLAERAGTLRRNQDLHRQGFIGEAAVEQSEAAAVAARSDVEYRKARLAKSQLAVADASLKAPFAGVIGERFVQPNEQVGAGSSVMTVLGDEKLEVQISVPEIAIAGIAVGMPARISFGALPGRTFPGSVDEIGRVAGAGNVYPVMIALQSATDRLRAGMTAEVTLLSAAGPGQAQGLRVPVSALRPGTRQGEGHVFVVDPGSGTARQVPVTVVAVRDNDAVISGIESGARIIIAGVSFLSDGQAVRPMVP